MNFDEIIFKTNLSDSVTMKIDDEKINPYYDFEMVEEIAVNKYEIEIFSANEEGEELNKLGNIKGTFINVDLLHESGYDSYDVLDAIGDEVNIYSYFYDKDGNDIFDEKTADSLVGINPNIFILDSIYIEKEYRNMGLGSKILKSLNDIILCVLQLQVGVITFQVEPFEYNTDNNPENKDIKDIKKLEKFYEKCGYKKIPGISKIHGKFSQFYKNTDLI